MHWDWKNCGTRLKTKDDSQQSQNFLQKSHSERFHPRPRRELIDTVNTSIVIDEIASLQSPISETLNSFFCKEQRAKSKEQLTMATAKNTLTKRQRAKERQDETKEREAAVTTARRAKQAASAAKKRKEKQRAEEKKTKGKVSPVTTKKAASPATKATTKATIKATKASA